MFCMQFFSSFYLRRDLFYQLGGSLCFYLYLKSTLFTHLTPHKWNFWPDFFTLTFLDNFPSWGNLRIFLPLRFCGGHTNIYTKSKLVKVPKRALTNKKVLFCEIREFSFFCRAHFKVFLKFNEFLPLFLYGQFPWIQWFSSSIFFYRHKFRFFRECNFFSFLLHILIHTI